MEPKKRKKALRLLQMEAACVIEWIKENPEKSHLTPDEAAQACSEALKFPVGKASMINLANQLGMHFGGRRIRKVVALPTPDPCVHMIDVLKVEIDSIRAEIQDLKSMQAAIHQLFRQDPAP